MSLSRLRVALVQHSNQGDRADNLQFIEHEIAAARDKGVKLILLQELHNTAYFCQTEDTAAFDMAETIPGPSSRRLARMARKHQVVIVASLFERRTAGLFHNTAVVFEADGTLAGRYRKMHIPDDPGFYEKFYFTPGDLGFAPIETSVGRLGVLVCWDQWFPEAARLLTLAGAELLLYPTAIGWDMRDPDDERERQLDAWVTIQRAHAIANGVPVLSCNRVGFEPPPVETDPGIQFWGNSFACGPQGEWLGRAGDDIQTLLVDVDLERAETVRRVWPFLRDRRIDAYDGLLKRFLD
jgi:N-carbamoylputrescine amidase